MNKKLLLKLITSATVYLFFVPQSVYASQLDFVIVQSNITNDKNTIVEIYLDPQSKNINVVEGIIAIKGTKADSEIFISTETGDSVLNLWPVVPEYSKNEKVIRFAGGSTSGFDKRSLLFRIQLQSEFSQDITFTQINGSAFLNNGEATRENIFSRSITVAVDKQDPSTMFKTFVDNTPPDIETVEIGKDDSGTYEGKYFIAISATDDYSGVKQYEVEENGEKTIVNNGIYVLKDQSLNGFVFITITDNTGNIRSERIEIRKLFNNNVWLTPLSLIGFVILLMVLVMLAVFINKSFKQKHEKNNF